eukprot:scaffold5041_cov42-Attheya_sp.AAC.3
MSQTITIIKSETAYYILKETAPLANLIRTHHCVGIEPMGLLPKYPTNRPADVALKLHPHYADRLHPSPHTIAAIDCTIIPLLQPKTPSSSNPPPTPPPLIPPPPPLPPEPDPKAVTPIPPDPSSPALRKHHFRYEFEKFKGRTRTNSRGKHIWGTDVIDDCNQQKFLLLPFTIDPNGMLGPTAQNFLFGTPTEDDFPVTCHLSPVTPNFHPLAEKQSTPPEALTVSPPSSNKLTKLLGTHNTPTPIPLLGSVTRTTPRLQKDGLNLF